MTIATLGLAGFDLVAEAGLGSGDSRPLSFRLTLVLLSLAGLCVSGLTSRRAPSIAGFGLVWAAGMAAIDALGLLRSADLTVASAAGESAAAGASANPIDAWLDSVIRAAMAFVALGPLVRNGIGARPGVALGAAAIGTLAVIAATLWATMTVGGAITSLGGTLLGVSPSSVANRILLVDVVVLAALAALLDLGPPSRAAHARLVADRSSRAEAGGSAFRDGPGPLAGSRAMLGFLFEAAAPGFVQARRAAAERERRRLAAELHAGVLPELRVALATARTADSPAVEQRLRVAVDEVEQLMAAREPTVVDALGLVAGLEWLAERVQARYSIPITLDLADQARPEDAIRKDAIREDAIPEDAIAKGGLAEPPAGVQRAAFRVAQLALDNAGRHSGASTISIGLSMTMGALRLVVHDDGRSGDGFPNGASPGRGLRDMRDEADAIGAALTLRNDGGSIVELDWPRRE